MYKWHQPQILNNLCTTKERKYELRNISIIDRAKVQTNNHGLKSFKDYGAKIWNSLLNSCKWAISVEYFKALIKSLNGQNVLARYVSFLLDSDVIYL